MFLEVNHISKAYEGKQVLRDLHLSCAKGETLSVLGTSGCGKTTLLKILAGIEPCDSGSFAMGGAQLENLSAQQREVIYLFQEALLFPHLTVFENIAFGLRIRKQAENEIQDAVEDMIQDLGLGEKAQKMPEELSGGQKQRVAFGRALILQPKLLLLDEPFSSLDYKTKKTMQELFVAMTQKHGITSLFVTHDVREALVVGTQWAYLDAGAITHFKTKKDFMADGRTGVKQEKDFWENLN